MKFDTRKQIGVGLLVTLGFPMIPISTAWELARVGHMVCYEMIWWAVVAGVLLYVLLAEKRALSSVGLRRPGRADVAIAVGAGVVIVAGLAVIYFVVLPALHLNEGQRVDALLAPPLWWRIISVVRAGVGEEVLYRGYAMERLRELSGSRPMAAGVTWALFTVAHVGPWGWAHLLIAGFGGAMLTLLYVWRRNLWVNIIAHAIVDGVAVLSG